MHIANNAVRPKEIQKLLAKVEGTNEEALISRLALRSMKQAKYTPENTGHFGLATTYYCHFTSPIRRYPDLQIHRIIKEDLRGRMNDNRREHYEKIHPEVTKQCSERERLAEEAERETIKLKKVEYMEEHIGEVFEGVISSITKWGIYVELPNTIEGLVHVTNMHDDHYDYIEERFEMVGEHTRKVYKLGLTVNIVATGTDRLQRARHVHQYPHPAGSSRQRKPQVGRLDLLRYRLRTAQGHHDGARHDTRRQAHHPDRMGRGEGAGHQGHRRG